MHLGNEAFYGLLYLAYFWPGPSLHFISFTYFLALMAFSMAALKSWKNLMLLSTACQAIAAINQTVEQNQRIR
jgi:hypothetical protein